MNVLKKNFSFVWGYPSQMVKWRAEGGLQRPAVRDLKWYRYCLNRRPGYPFDNAGCMGMLLY